LTFKQNPQNYLYSDLAIQRACEKVEADLSVKHSIGVLARHAGLAEHHFQRRFAVATGETVGGYLRARRLEKAALALLASRQSILDIALQIGFETHSSFSRAFKHQFGLSPSQFRKTGGRCDIKGEAPRPYLIPTPANAVFDGFDLVEAPAAWLCWRKFTGMKAGRYFTDLGELRHALEELGREWLQFCKRDGRDQPLQIASAFEQGPSSFEDKNAEAFVGGLFDERVPLDWPEGWTRLPARTYAVFPHFGPLLALPLTWNKAARVALKHHGLTLDDDWMFETYLTSNLHEAPFHLSALIYLPVSKAEQEQK